LGLAICRSIVEAHDGRIWADDNADADRGARFTMAIPSAANQHDGQTTDASDATPEAAAG
jgi:K+-sensing histidine kinase KdpD